MDTAELKESIKSYAETNGIDLPKGWYNRSSENLSILLEDIKSAPVAPVVSTQPEEKIPGSAPAEIKPKAGHLTPIEIDTQNKSFLKRLQASEYVDIEIDPSGLYPEGSTVPIGLNGVTFYIPVGIYFEKGVPKAVKDVWDYSKRETRKANTAMKKKLTAEIRIQ